MVRNSFFHIQYLPTNVLCAKSVCAEWQWHGVTSVRSRERESVCSAETGKQSMKLDAVNVYSLGDLSVNT